MNFFNRFWINLKAFYRLTVRKSPSTKVILAPEIQQAYDNVNAELARLDTIRNNKQ